MIKYVFIQDDPFYLPKVLDKYLREYHDSTAGINVQSVSQGNRTLLHTAASLYKTYGPYYFQLKTRRYLIKKVRGMLENDLLGLTKACHSVKAVAKKYKIPITSYIDVNSDQFLSYLTNNKIELIVSISGTQLYRKKLRELPSAGIINCHGGLLPRYRGLMPSYWTLANGEQEGGVSVHFVDDKLDNGPIVVQRKYRINPRDSLEQVMDRSKDLAAEAIIEAVRLVEAGSPPLSPNPEELASHYSMPTREDTKRLIGRGHSLS